MNILVREYTEKDLPEMIDIWNEIVEEGIAFPQEELLDIVSGRDFFASQTYTGVAVDETTDKVYGLYILHPNNIGRCGHICNASYAVSSSSRGLHIGEKLVLDCIEQGKTHGFGVLQFNAVVATNTHARHLYERLGFTQLGVIPKGFRMKDGHFEDICPYYRELYYSI
ncbi:MAG: GNAT family N-acetyltransferase [Lachnospiraceae bacterium]|nr:GNAT family N-acetyltransferase [Lachnospiraceae bacterium]